MRVWAIAIAATMLLTLPCLAQTPDFSDVLVAQIHDMGKLVDLKTNVYLPVNATGASPLVLYIHGKGGRYDDPRDAVVQRLLSALLARGVAVARIDYRPSGRMPQMLFDAKSYLRFFRAHAATYHIDPNRIGVWGVSRGGNIAALLAVTGNVKSLEGEIGGNTDQSSMVEASVIESPLTDLFLSSDEKAASMFGDYLGTNTADSKSIVAAYRNHDMSSPWWKEVERIEQVNPLNYVNENSPPALIICGGRDPSNVILNCTALFDRYIEKGALASYYALSIGTHVRVGTDIENASISWLAERLSTNPPPIYPP